MEQAINKLKKETLGVCKEYCANLRSKEKHTAEDVQELVAHIKTLQKFAAKKIQKFLEKYWSIVDAKHSINDCI